MENTIQTQGDQIPEWRSDLPYKMCKICNEWLNDHSTVEYLQCIDAMVVQLEDVRKQVDDRYGTKARKPKIKAAYLLGADEVL